MASSNTRKAVLPSINTSLGAGAYDSKLVTSSLTQGNANEPTSPTNLFSPQAIPQTDHPRLGHHKSSISGGGSHTPISSTGPGQRQGSIVIDGHPSHPSSPWSVLTLHVLPVFNGMPLMQPIEELNKLAESHINTTRTRSPRNFQSILSSDLQELLSTGMLTLKAKLDSVTDEGKLLARAAETWWFFFQTIPYLQGVFLPLSVLMNDQTLSPNTPQTPSGQSTTDVRHLLLSSFLLHILLPLLPRLLGTLNQVSLLNAPGNRQTSFLTLPTPDQLGRLQHMSLILSTQAKCSSLNTATATQNGGVMSLELGANQEERDEDVRRDVEQLLKAVLKIKNGGRAAYLPVLGGRDEDEEEDEARGGDLENLRPWAGQRPRRKVWREASWAPARAEADDEQEAARRASMVGETRPRGISVGESSLTEDDDDESSVSQVSRPMYASSMESKGESTLARPGPGTYAELGALGVPATFQSEASSAATPTATLTSYARDAKTMRPR